MRWRLIWTGKTRDSNLRGLTEEYAKRLRKFVRCEITELRESPNTDARSGIDKDSRRISDGLQSAAFVVLLDRKGVEWSSEELAVEVERWESNGVREVAFIVGGPGGVSQDLVKRANRLWSLSQLTLTHEMARVVLLEQLYRAFTIIHRLPYHK
ncbi:MAG TPA: 23S rRNA (pseudouridine(1915)-N(3))-methyltransferase RlmH [Pyrinomonadaceae bacterium]